MPTYTITINERTNKAKALIKLLKKAEKEDKKNINVSLTPNLETQKAIIEGRKEKTKAYSSVEEFNKALGI